MKQMYFKTFFRTQTAASSGIIKIVRTELFLYVSTHDMQINIIKKKVVLPTFLKMAKTSFIYVLAFASWDSKEKSLFIAPSFPFHPLLLQNKCPVLFSRS